MSEEVHSRIKIVDIWWDRIGAAVPAYLIKGEVNAMIDSGPPQKSSDVMASALKAFGVTPADIALVLNTHGHADHTGGNEALKTAGRARMLIHEEDAYLLEDPARAFDEFYGVATKALGDERRLGEEREAFLKQAGSGLAVDRYLQDNDTITVGDGMELRVVHLPGHSRGSVGYYWEKEGILIAGDAIPGLGNPGGSLPIVHDVVDYEKSIDRLLAMPLQTLVFTHAYRGINLAPSAVRRGQEIREYLSDSREFAKGLAEALTRRRAGKNGSVVEAADRVIADLPAEMGFVPVAKQSMPHFTLMTVFWALSGSRDPRERGLE